MLWKKSENILTAKSSHAPSRSEGQPLTFLEAMTSQLNVESTSVGGIPETLCGYGYKTHISHCSTGEISAGILEVLEAISKEKSIDSKSVPHAERFDWSHVMRARRSI